MKNMQMLKFGRLVDLEKLENVTVNRTVEELKEKLRQAEYESAMEIGKWEVSGHGLSKTVYKHFATVHDHTNEPLVWSAVWNKCQRVV